MTKQNNFSKLDKYMNLDKSGPTDLQWHSPSSNIFRITGFPWYEQDKKYRRLPVAPRFKIPEPVNILADCTAGGQISFQTDSTHISIRAEVSGKANMNHMPATGQCGFDLYVGLPCAQRFHNVTKFALSASSYEVLLFDHPEKVMRNFTINFPLYTGVKELYIGLDPDANNAPPLPWEEDGKIVIYGTSITQGGCASRPGMAFTNILSRLLNVEVINLGFSGNGRGEPEVIELMADIPSPKLLILDYHANAAGKLKQTLPVAMQILRKRHPEVPILMVSRIAYAKDATHPTSIATREEGHDIYTRVLEQMQSAGDSEVFFVDGTNLLGSDYDECTVDGVHPSDLGFMRIARGLEPEILKIMEKKR